MIQMPAWPSDAYIEQLDSARVLVAFLHTDSLSIRDIHEMQVSLEDAGLRVFEMQDGILAAADMTAAPHGSASVDGHTASLEGRLMRALFQWSQRCAGLSIVAHWGRGKLGQGRLLGPAPEELEVLLSSRRSGGLEVSRELGRRLQTQGWEIAASGGTLSQVRFCPDVDWIWMAIGPSGRRSAVRSHTSLQHFMQAKPQARALRAYASAASIDAEMTDEGNILVLGPGDSIAVSAELPTGIRAHGLLEQGGALRLVSSEPHPTPDRERWLHRIEIVPAAQPGPLRAMLLLSSVALDASLPGILETHPDLETLIKALTESAIAQDPEATVALVEVQRAEQL